MRKCGYESCSAQEKGDQEARWNKMEQVENGNMHGTVLCQEDLRIFFESDGMKIKAFATSVEQNKLNFGVFSTVI